MDQQQVNRERLQRDIAYQVAELRKAQHRRLGRLRDELRYAALPTGQLDRAFSDVARHWDDAFTRLERDLIVRGEYLLANGTTYQMLRTELMRLATTTLHNLLDTDLTPGGEALCTPRDRVLYLTTRGWNGVLAVAVLAAIVLAATGTLSAIAAIALAGGALLVRVLLHRLCTWHSRAFQPRVTALIAHLNRVTMQFSAELERLPDALERAFEDQRSTA